LKNKDIISALVFSRTKHGANKIVKYLEKAGLQAEAIHGNKSQNARQLALNNFKERKTRILVATDIAARGIDIEELSHVINFDLPEVPETYVHRIGRTGRARRGGIAISFCSHLEKPLLKSIEKLISKTLEETIEHPYPLKDMSIKASVKPTKGNTSKKTVTKDKARSGRKNNNIKKKVVKNENLCSKAKGHKPKID